MILTYSLATDFPNGIYVKDLQKSLALVFHPVVSTTIKQDVVTLNYLATKTQTELDIINGVIVDHTGIKSPTDVIYETIMLVPTDTEVKNSNDWQDFGGVIVSPDAFPIDMGNVKGQVTGQYRLGSGMDAEISLLETGIWNGLPDVELIEPPHILPPTGGMWLPFTVFTTVQVRSGYWSYVFRARKGLCNEFYLRYLTVAIVEERV